MLGDVEQQLVRVVPGVAGVVIGFSPDFRDLRLMILLRMS